jgi:large subunit ribosomal protein L22
MIVSGLKAIPFRRFNRNAHKRGLPATGMQADTRKGIKAYIRSSNRKEECRIYRSDADNLEIIHVSANRGRAQKSFFPRAMGRATPKVRETVNIEVVVREVV